MCSKEIKEGLDNIISAIAHFSLKETFTVYLFPVESVKESIRIGQNCPNYQTQQVISTIYNVNPPPLVKICHQYLIYVRWPYGNLIIIISLVFETNPYFAKLVHLSITINASNFSSSVYHT